MPATILPSPDLIGTSLYAALAERGAAPAHGVQRIDHLAAAAGAVLLEVATSTGLTATRGEGAGRW